MSAIGGSDHVVPVDGAPRPPGGPACATVIADEHATVLIYLVAGADWPQEAALAGGTEFVAVCRFTGVRGFYVGALNDEALENHSLFGRGLSFYGVFEVQSSSWAARLAELAIKKEAKPFKQPQRSHFVVPMQDETFGCVASEASFEIRAASLTDVVNDVVASLQSS